MASSAFSGWSGSSAPAPGTPATTGAVLSRTTAWNSPSLEPKLLYTVILDTPASAAMASTLARSRPCSLKCLCAASRMRRTRSGSRGRPRWGLGVGAEGCAMGRFSGLDSSLYSFYIIVLYSPIIIDPHGAHHHE